MPWDRLVGRCISVAANTTLYEVKVFDITGDEVVRTRPNGDIPDLNDHVHIPAQSNDEPDSKARVAIITKWNEERTEVAASKLYVHCAPEYETMWLRVFTGFGGLGTPPKYGGQMIISPIPNIHIPEQQTFEIGDVGKLVLKPLGGSNSSDAQPVVHAGPFYSEVSTLQDGAGSEWFDEEFPFTNAVFASIGTFFYNAPAQRPDSSPDAWWLQQIRQVAKSVK